MNVLITPYAYRMHPMKIQIIPYTYPTNLTAIIALIFFCFLFFHQGKKRKSGRGGEAPAKARGRSLGLSHG